MNSNTTKAKNIFKYIFSHITKNEVGIKYNSWRKWTKTIINLNLNQNTF